MRSPTRGALSHGGRSYEPGRACHKLAITRSIFRIRVRLIYTKSSNYLLRARSRHCQWTLCSRCNQKSPNASSIWLAAATVEFERLNDELNLKLNLKPNLEQQSESLFLWPVLLILNFKFQISRASFNHPTAPVAGELMALETLCFPS